VTVAARPLPPDESAASPGRAGPRPSPALVGGALLWAAGLTLLLYYLLFYLQHAAALAAYPYDVDQGEGYDVNSGWLLWLGQPIYTDNSRWPYYSSNYPPVFSLLLAPIVGVFGPSLAAGRLLSAAAALLTALAIGLIVKERAGHGPAALSAGLLFLASNYVYHVTPLARVNALAVLFGLLGVYCCSRDGLRWRVGAAVLFLLALYTKQTTIDAVAAGLLWLLVRDRRAGIAVVAAMGVVGGLIWLAIDLRAGGQFFVNIVVGNVNPWTLGQTIDYFRNFLEIHAILVGLAAWRAWRAWRERAWGPFELYWLFALGLAVTVGKWGAGESYFLAPIAASCVLAGDALARLARSGAARPALALLAGALVVGQGALMAHGPLYRLGPAFADRGAQAAVLARQPTEADLRAAGALVAELRKSERPVLSEDPGYALAAGHPVVGNATHLRNVHLAGAWSPDALVADVRARRFGWVVLNAELYPEPVLEVIGQSYYLYEEYEILGTRQRLFAPGGE
jgi:4-amino-4-deoxy-L-arabinose transferase-like glycosyltransferase